MGKLFLIGLQDDGRLSIFERTFNRCMGLHATRSTLWMSTLYQLWRFENALEAVQNYQGYDAFYVPRLAYTTGDIDGHDIGVDDKGAPLLVNTLFSCLARPSETASFTPVWQLEFISRLAAEERCHLNGLAMDEGRPRYVTAVSYADVADGWRDRLWVLNSGAGEFGYVDIASGHFEAVAFLPGYLRSLAFCGDFAVVGLSTCRENHAFSDLPLDAELSRRDAEPRCAIAVVDLKSGDAVHWLRINGFVKELYEVSVVPGIRRPMALGFKSDEIRRRIVVG